MTGASDMHLAGSSARTGSSRRSGSPAASTPSARLFYNEVRADVPNPKYEAMLAMARDFKARGVPLDGVGLQYHLSENQPTQAQMEEGIRRLGELGLEVHISELDVPIWYLGPPTIPERLALQPEIYRRVASACQAQPACFRITTWGFTDRLTYRCCNAKPLPFDEEYRPKPAWAVLQEVLRPGGRRDRSHRLRRLRRPLRRQPPRRAAR